MYVCLCCSKTLNLTQAQFEAQDWVYSVAIATANSLMEPLTVPNVTLTVQHAPKLQLTLDNSSCTFDGVDGEAWDGWSWRLKLIEHRPLVNNPAVAGSLHIGTASRPKSNTHVQSGFTCKRLPSVSITGLPSRWCGAPYVDGFTLNHVYVLLQVLC